MRKIIWLLVIFFVLGCKKISKNSVKDEITVPLSTPEMEKEKTEKEEEKTLSLLGEWGFINLKNDSTEEGSIRFISDIKLIGHDGCNQFFGHYSVVGKSLSFRNMSATKKTCPDYTDKGIMQLLPQVSSCEIEENILTLRDGEKVLLKLRKQTNE